VTHPNVASTMADAAEKEEDEAHGTKSNTNEEECGTVTAPKTSPKERCAKILNSYWMSAFMTVITFYALYAGDVRVLAFDAQSDIVFYVFTAIIFFAFALEFLLNCWCREHFFVAPTREKLRETVTDARLAESRAEFLSIIPRFFRIGSFYFWLDLLATLSLLFELPLLYEGNRSIDLINSGEFKKASTAARMLKIIRMVRLVRLVRLYKYISNKKSNKGSSGSVSPESNDGAGSKPQESRIGAKVSDRITKKVIVGILIMLVAIPLLQVNDLEYINELGLNLVFRRRVAFYEVNGRPKSSPAEKMLALTSWKKLEEYFVRTTTCISINYENFDDVNVDPIIIPDDRISPDRLRSSDKVELSMKDDKLKLGVVAIFDISYRTKEEATLGIILTTFVIILLTLGTYMFSRDVKILVIIPIEQMVQLVQEISANPLSKSFSLTSEDLKKMNDGMETTLLLQTISKIAGLMRVCFGEAGAKIIAKNLNLQAGSENLNLPAGSVNFLENGAKIQSIFAFCDIRNFTDTTECLQEEVMLFVNRIAHILHGIVVQCNGAANKNIGDAFLLTWKVDGDGRGDGGCDDCADRALYSLLKTMAEMHRHESFICNFSPHSLSKLFERMPGYKCRMGCGLHFGWAVEGAIGSDKKIDASYISPHVNMSEFLEGSTKEYGVPLLMSEPFFDLLSTNVRSYCRQVDCIKKKHENKSLGLFTYDTNLDLITVKKKLARKIIRPFSIEKKWSNIKNRRANSNNSAKDSRSSISSQLSDSANEAPEIILPPFSLDVWDDDGDMVNLRHQTDENFCELWRGAFEEGYIAGDWQRARAVLEEMSCVDGQPPSDGPSNFLWKIMEEHDFVAPEKWRGVREL